MTLLHSEESINSYFIDQIKDYAIFATDTKGYITAWNKGAERLKGYTPAEVIGKYYGILHPEDYQRAGMPEEELKIARETGVYETEDWRMRKDGSLFWASVTLTAIYSDEGEHIGFTKVTGDISKQKELQEKLAARQQSTLELKNKELRKINLDLDNFVYTASHDLRSPITNIEALMGILKGELQQADCLNKVTEEVLQRVLDSVHRFQHTIKDLTEISRLQHEVNQELSEEVLNIGDVYKSIMADIDYPTKLQEFFIQTDFQVYQLKFSRKNFRSILYNLISNAIKYQSPERECLIKINTRLEEPYVVLRVKDNGLGLSKKNQAQLFTMFKRFHDHVQGTGVGLFMVKRIIENADGKIEVNSEEGVGTEFKVYFPAEVDEA